MAETTIFRAVARVETRQAQNGRTYYKVSDDTGLEWTCWDANVAITANSLVNQGLMQWKVRISPARDPQYGLNYSLLAIAPAPPGSQPTPPGQEQSGEMVQPQMPQPMPQMMPLLPQATPQQIAQQAQAPLPGPPAKTMGQGGSYSDADLTRMARSTAIEAAASLAIAFPKDFSDPEGTVGERSFDWMKFWSAAEALHKFILQRSHQGWVPGIELEAPERPSGSQQVLAEVEAQFGEGLVQEGFAEAPEAVPVADASADNASGGEVGWGE
jgi:hypothetical protein